MASLEMPAHRATPPEQPVRVRIPASRGGIAWVAVLVIIGTFLAVQIGRQVYASWSITQQADAIRVEIAQMQARNDALRQELVYLHSKAFLAAEARRLLNLGLPGDQVLIIPPGAEAPLPAALIEKLPPARPLVEQWLELFFGP